MATEKWHRVQDVKAFMESRGQRTVAEHSMRSIKRLSWPVCARCGLLALRNDATRKALREKCVVEE